jgi:hypothetical protein
MKLFKYGTKQGKTTFTCEGRQFVLGFQFTILTGKQEEVVLEAMKKSRNIRQYPVDEIEMANYLRTHSVSNNDFSKATDAEVKSEFYKRFPDLKKAIFDRSVTNVISVPESDQTSIDANTDTNLNLVKESIEQELGLEFDPANESVENSTEEIPTISDTDTETLIADTKEVKVNKLSDKKKNTVKSQL